MRRKRIDWAEENRKTEQIRARGFKTSALSFGVALVFLFGISRINEKVSMMPIMIMVMCFAAAMAVLVMTLRRRARINRENCLIDPKKDRDDQDDE